MDVCIINLFSSSEDKGGGSIGGISIELFAIEVDGEVVGGSDISSGVFSGDVEAHVYPFYQLLMSLPSVSVILSNCFSYRGEFASSGNGVNFGLFYVYYQKIERFVHSI